MSTPRPSRAPATSTTIPRPATSTPQEPRSRAPPSTSTRSSPAGQAANVRSARSSPTTSSSRNTGDTTLTTVPLADTFDPAQLELVSTSVQPTDAPLAGCRELAERGRTSRHRAGRARSRSPSPSARWSPVPTSPTPRRSPALSTPSAIPPPTRTDTDSTLGVYEPGTVRRLEDGRPRGRHHRAAGRHDHLHAGVEQHAAGHGPGRRHHRPAPRLGRLHPRLDACSGTTSQTDAADGDAGTFDAASNTVSFHLGDVSAMSSGTATFEVVVGPENRSRAGVMNSALYKSSRYDARGRRPGLPPGRPVHHHEVRQGPQRWQAQGRRRHRVDDHRHQHRPDADDPRASSPTPCPTRPPT